MRIIGIGIDLVDCGRIQNSIDRFGERFLKRVFTDGEIAYSNSMKFPARHFAARFAAKEALSKAFGTGIGKSMAWRDLDVRKKESGEPYVVLSGGAERMANEREVGRVWISLSHTEQSGMATIILEAFDVEDQGRSTP
jgi:holo-[acyl-carrier protein] synthase